MAEQNVTCAIDGCEKPPTRRKMCNGHYLKLMRYGDPLGGSWVQGGKRPSVHDGLPCSVDGCDRASKLAGMCKLHYGRIYRTGDVGPAGLIDRGSGVTCCAVSGCDRDGPFTRGLCPLHYNRSRRTGDAGSISLKISPAGTGSLKNGYRIINRKLQHRQVMEEFLGRPLLKSESVHHRNGDRLDNRLENLELWSKSQPAGQRVIDKVAWAREILATYEGIEPQLRLF